MNSRIFHRSELIAAIVLFGPGLAPAMITSVEETGLVGEAVAVIEPAFGEDVLTFSDRQHQHNGAAFNQATVGRVLPVLLERPGRHDGQMVGRTPYLQPVHLRAAGALPGDLIDVLIEESQPHSLAGAPYAAPRPEPQLREACA